MTDRSKVLAAIAASVLVIGGIWFFSKHPPTKAPVTTSQALSSSKVPPTQLRTGAQPQLRAIPLRHELRAQPNHSAPSMTEADLKIAQASLSSAMRCKWAADTERGIRDELDKPAASIASGGASSIEDDKLKLLQDRLRQLQGVRATCPEQSTDQLDKDVYDKLLAAAQLGDRNAVSCYIAASYAGPSLQADPSAFDEYNSNSSSLIEAGLAAGDWNMVYLLESGSNPSLGQTGWFDSLFVHDALTTYRYKKLRRLGTIGEEATALDAELGRLERRLISSGAATADDIRNADQWAQGMYNTYFTTSERLTGTPSPCQDPTGGLQSIAM